MLNSDYSDMLRALSACDVKFMLVGDYALGALGYPRATLDIDLWVMPSPENAVAVMRALKLFGAPMADISEADFISEGTIFQIGVAPRRIDIITKIDGVAFEDAFRRAKVVELAGASVRVLSLEDLLANKRASGRLKDLADVELLERLLADKDNSGE